MPAAIYLAWFLALGRSGVGFARDPFTAEALADVPRFVVEGLGDAAGSAVGVGPIDRTGRRCAGPCDRRRVGLVVGRAPGARFIGTSAGIVAMYAILGLVRGDVLETAALYPRYAYLLRDPLRDRDRLAGGRSTLRRTSVGRSPSTRSAISVLAMSLVWNVRLLILGRDVFLERADLTRALVTTALDPDLPTVVDRDRDLILVPSPNSLERIVRTHGSPLRDWFSDPLPEIPEEVLDEAWRRVLAGDAASYPRIGRPARP